MHRGDKYAYFLIDIYCQVMMNGLFRFFRFQFQQAKNAVMQIVLLNVVSFLALLFLRTGLLLLGGEKIYTALLQALVLPSSWSAYGQQPWALLTYSWINTSFFTTLWGIAVIYFVGPIVVNLIGNWHLIVIYLLGGVIGGGFFLLLYQFSPYLYGTSAVLLGFSGGLYAILVAAATLAPQLNFYFFLLGPIKFKYITSFLLLLSFIDLSGSSAADSIAQLGGALVGYLYIKQLYSFPSLSGYWRRWWGPRNKLKVSYRRQPSTADKDHKNSVDDGKLESILDKVAERGYEGLSEAEKRQLFEAGK